jgi:hypothetical protein
VWFEAELDDDTVMSNAPMSDAPGRGDGGHWGRLVCAWADERGVREGERVRLELVLDDGEIDVRLC